MTREEFLLILRDSDLAGEALIAIARALGVENEAATHIASLRGMEKKWGPEAYRVTSTTMRVA